MKKNRIKQKLKFLSENDFLFEDLDESVLLPGRQFFFDEKLFLGAFENHEIKKFLKKKGVFIILRKKGYDDLDIKIEISTRYDNRITIIDNKTKEKIIFMRLHRSLFSAQELSSSLANLDILFIDWLLLQDVRQKSKKEKEKLYPGQKHHGLGIFLIIKRFIESLVLDKNINAAASVPEYFHDAVLFARHFKYLKPESQALFDLLREEAKTRSLKELSLLIENKKVSLQANHQKEAFTFNLGEMIAPNCSSLLEYFESNEYERRYRQTKKEAKFYI
ncbi:MAG: hypothetical protein OEZ13_07945 [Spirochaetia bacterium]|nr:hypothetical protein [Spirochaetia bacterium]